jgi:hypothetical protein
LNWPYTYYLHLYLNIDIFSIYLLYQLSSFQIKTGRSNVLPFLPPFLPTVPLPSYNPSFLPSYNTYLLTALYTHPLSQLPERKRGKRRKRRKEGRTDKRRKARGGRKQDLNINFVLRHIPSTFVHLLLVLVVDGG